MTNRLNRNSMTYRSFAIVLLSICSLALFPETGYGQYPQVPVTISSEKVKIDGKVFYSHIVLEKQTLYSISKAYGVSVQDIYAANPNLETDGLKKNAIILIPVPDHGSQQAKTARYATADEGNSSAGNTDKDGSSAITEEPSEKKTPDDTRKARKQTRKDRAKNEDIYLIHTVRWYEDLDVISEKYGVPVDIIIEVNGLSGRKLTNRQKLRIPADLKAYMEERSSSQDPHKEIDVPTKEESHDPGLTTTVTPASRGKVNVMLMLPLNATAGKASESNMDFYSGALIAAREAGFEGTGVDLSVYDVADGTIPMTENRIAVTDVTIGPVSRTDLTTLLSKVPEDFHVVSPFDPRAESMVAGHRNLIQAPASVYAQYENLASWIKSDRKPAEKLVVIYEKGMRETTESSAAETFLQAAGLQYSSFSYSILEGRNVLVPIKGLMAQGKINRVLVVSESEAFVNDLVRNLNLMVHDNYPIVLYGPSKLRSFETIDVEDYHNVNLHLAMSYYVDYDSREVQKFLMEYRALCNTEPGPFAFQGYDLMRYFVLMCSKYGDSWADHLESEETVKMLQSDFRFRRYGEGGLENIGIRRIIYGPDYSVSLIN